MIVNKKLDRFRQWAGERMGGEVKTTYSDDMKALETDMNVRNDGLDRMHKCMAAYIKGISKRNEGEDKEKTLPIAQLGSSMVGHGEDFDASSEYGQCLRRLGRAEERLARIQESYITEATSSWLESLERSLAQMKEYQISRKRLDSRRLAYDTTLTKMQKAKREDYRLEEEMRTQKVKYEEATDDVYRRMQEIKDSEPESVADLTSFLEAQLDYHERCREVLLQLRNDWPAGLSQSHTSNEPRPHRPRSNTARSCQERYEPLHEEPHSAAHSRPILQSRQPSYNLAESTVRDNYAAESSVTRLPFNRSQTFEGPFQLRQERSFSPSRLSRVVSELPIRSSQAQSQEMNRRNTRIEYSEEAGPFGAPSPDRSYSERSTSPSTSYGSMLSRNTSVSTVNSFALSKKTPPPVPSRMKKPPPPPPMKRPSIGV